MEENKQIDQKLQQEATEQNEAPVIDKDSVDILDLLETASSWLVSPEDKEAEKKFNEIKNQIIVKSFLPLTMKNALVKKAIFDLRTSDDSIDEFPQALEISLLFNVLLAYTNIEWEDGLEVKDAAFYDILWASGVCDMVLEYCRSDYERVVRMVENMFSFENLYNLVETINKMTPDSVEELTKEVKRIRLESDPQILHDYATLARAGDPILHKMADAIEDTAYKAAKGEIPEDTYTTTIDLNIDAFIPPTYIPNEYQKLDIYKRIAAIETEEEREDMLEELIDRFGEPPKKVQQLLTIAQIKAFAHSSYIIAIEQKGEDYQFTMYEKAKVSAQKIPVLLDKYKGALTFKVDVNPYFIYRKLRKTKKEKDEQVLENVKQIIADIHELIEE